MTLRGPKKKDIFGQRSTFQENYCILRIDLMLSHEKLGMIFKKINSLKIGVEKKNLTKNGLLNYHY